MDQLKHKFHNHILYPLPRFSSAPVFFLRYDGFWTVGSGHVLSSTWTWTPIFRISSSSTLFGFCNWNLTAADIRNLRERCYILLFAMNWTCLEDNSSPPVLGPCCPIYYLGARLQQPHWQHLIDKSTPRATRRWCRNKNLVSPLKCPRDKRLGDRRREMGVGSHFLWTSLRILNFQECCAGGALEPLDGHLTLVDDLAFLSSSFWWLTHFSTFPHLTILALDSLLTRSHHDWPTSLGENPLPTLL